MSHTAQLSSTLDKPVNPPHALGLIAGNGTIPLAMAKTALKQGYALTCFSLSGDNRKALEKQCPTSVYPIAPGLLEQTLTLLRKAQVTQVVFGGKVDKWILLRNPRLDARGRKFLSRLSQVNDDALMLGLIQELEAEGITVLSQADFMQDLFTVPGHLAGPPLTEREQLDLDYGFQLAKTMGGADVGQTVVVNKGMPIAIEAIEGTDVCLRRAGALIHGPFVGQKRLLPGFKPGGVMVKTAKPNQDLRFDIPTAGLRTLRTMYQSGLRVLAVEARATLLIDLPGMQMYADQKGISLLSL